MLRAIEIDVQVVDYRLDALVQQAVVLIDAVADVIAVGSLGQSLGCCMLLCA